MIPFGVKSVWESEKTGEQMKVRGRDQSYVRKNFPFSIRGKKYCCSEV